MEDTICAISTALGSGAISIIRLSGQKSIEIVNSIFDNDLLNKESHTINYGHIVYKGEVIDEVLVSIMKSPKTFTREDIIEINTHGGIAVTNKILEILLNTGARLALPGEFTKRAFLNGRIDLVEAESVMDLINSKTEKTRILAINGVEGKISDIVKELRKSILSIITNIEVNIDYPEYEDEVVITHNMLKENLKNISNSIEEILIKSKNSKIVKEGINVAILGRPNVGKSSILNSLLEEEKAIVTNISGTTRDFVEGSFMLNGININIIDTAGIRESNDIVEQIGINKSKKLVDDVDLIIVVFNNNEELKKEDNEILDLTKNKKRIIFINKNDLNKKIDINENNIIYGNTIEEKGLNELKEEIVRIFNLNNLNDKDLTYLSSARSISILNECQKLINIINTNINNNVPIDIIEIDIRKILDLLATIIGLNYDNEIIDELFSKFCLGK